MDDQIANLLAILLKRVYDDAVSTGESSSATLGVGSLESSIKAEVKTDTVTVSLTCTVDRGDPDGSSSSLVASEV